MRAALAALVGFAALSACAPRSETYEQSWPKPYGETTCAEWATQMSDDQQFAAAADLAWDYLQEQGATERPKTRWVIDYQDSMTQGCAAKPRMTIAQVARRLRFAD
jgi:hypothetical protein